MTSRPALRLTVEDRASAQNARMIPGGRGGEGARRCSMVIRRAYGRRARGGDLVVVGDDNGGGLAAEAGDDQLPGGAGVAGQFDRRVSVKRGLLCGPGRSRVIACSPPGPGW